MSVHKLKGRMNPHLWEKLKNHTRTANGSWDMPEGERWLALHRHHDPDANEWDLSENGPVPLDDVPWEEPTHGPNPVTMPMRDPQWQKVQEHAADPGTGVLVKPGESTFKLVARIEAPKARVICREV